MEQWEVRVINDGKKNEKQNYKKDFKNKKKTME